jgi:hypothetical protein
MHFNIEKRNLTDYVTSISNMIVMSISISFVVLFNRVEPEKANDFPYYLTIYGFHMIAPLLIIFSTSFMYFIRQPKLRKTIYRELVDWIGPFRNET